MKWIYRGSKLVSVAFVFAMLFTVHSGIASQYGPGVMQRTIRVRQSGRTSYDLPNRLPPVDGYAAHPLPEMIGEVVWVRPEGESHWYSVLIVDTADAEDGGLAFQVYGRAFPLSHAQGEWLRSQIRAGKLIPRVPLEVNYELAKEWDTVGRGIEIEIAYEHGDEGIYQDIGE